ncbi:MAG: hypothetical protein KDD52_04770, partial [Bdellovibrionales bacterium]|nr:hypothetical protein [Bdellovibrionales bacterium]
MKNISGILVLGSNPHAKAVQEILIEHHERVYVSDCTELFMQPQKFLSFLLHRNINMIIPTRLNHLEFFDSDFFSLRGIKIFSPLGESLHIEKNRSFAMDLCKAHDIPHPFWASFSSSIQAKEFLSKKNKNFVIKNLYCPSNSSLQAKVCKNSDELIQYLDTQDQNDDFFLQEYCGTFELGHVAMVDHGNIQSLVSNQEYKWSQDGNLGLMQSQPFGALAIQDPKDQFGLAKNLLLPLRPWFEKVSYIGPIQVTAIWNEGTWKVLEYNARLGVSVMKLLFCMLQDPVEWIRKACFEQILSQAQWKEHYLYGLSTSLYDNNIHSNSDRTFANQKIVLRKNDSTQLWWDQVEKISAQQYKSLGPRICEAAAFGP